MATLKTGYWDYGEPLAGPGATGVTGPRTSPGQADKAFTKVGPRPGAPKGILRDPDDGPNLNRKQREQLLARYKDRIDWARGFRDEQDFDARWKLMVDFYAGRQWPETMTDEDQITVNVTKSTVDVIAPSVAVNHPKIVVKATDSNHQGAATCTEHLVNYWWRHHEIKPEFRTIIKDYLVVGFGFAKCGYRFVQEEVNAEDSDIVQYRTQAYQEMDEYADANPDMAGDLPSEEDVEANIPDTKVLVKEDRPFIVRVSPYDIYVDPEATSFRDMRWIAQRIIRTLVEVQEDARYEVKARRALTPDRSLSEDIRGDTVDMRDAPADHQRVTVWEFYDLHANTISVFAESSEDYLVRPRWMPYEFGHPFVMIRNYDIPDEFYPMGEVESLLPLQEELNATRSDIVNHRKRWTPKYLYDPTRLDAKGIAALTSNIPNSLVPINDNNKPLSEAVLPLAQQTVPPEMYNWSESIEADIDKVSAVTEYQRGAMPEVRRTATEANIIQDAANARAADKLAQVEDFIGYTARRLVQLAQQYASKEQVIRTSNKDGYDLFWEWSPEDIRGEFDFGVVAGSTQPLNETERRSTAVNLLTAMAPYAQAGIIDIKKLLQHALEFGFGVDNAVEWFAPPAEKPEEGERDEREFLNMDYSKAPPDIQRQIEERYGFQPSQIGGTSIVEQDELKAETKTVLKAKDHEVKLTLAEQKAQSDHEKEELEIAKLAIEHEQESELEAEKRTAEARTQERDQAHQRDESQKAHERENPDKP